MFYYKTVAKTLGNYFSIYDGKTKYEIGKTLREEAKPDHKGGYYVYATVDQAVFADIAFHKGGLYFAPWTILKCACWGERITYENGKLAFEFIMPLYDMGMPRGYIATKTGLKDYFEKFK